MVEESVHGADLMLRNNSKARINDELEVTIYIPCAGSGFKFQCQGL